MPVEEQVVSIFAGVRGYLDRVAVGEIGRFETEYLNQLRSSHADILSAIRAEGEISEDTEAKLVSVLDAFVKKFA